VSMPQALRATNVGLYHITRLCRLFEYIDAIVVDVPIFDPDVRESIGVSFNIESRLDNIERFRQYLDDCWLPLRGSNSAFDWNSVSADLKSNIGRIKDRLQRTPTATQ
jgi:hypothetical protein